MHYKVISI